MWDDGRARARKRNLPWCEPRRVCRGWIFGQTVWNVVFSGQRGAARRIGRVLAPWLAGVTLWCAGVTEVAAAGGEHRVPDLRQEQSVQRQRSAAPLRIGLTLHVATAGQHLALDPRRLDRSLRRANAALADSGVEVYVAVIKLLPDGYTGIRHRRHRRALAQFAPNDGTIHVFLVDTVELGSVLRPHRSVRGLHWRYRGLSRKLRHREYLVIGSDAPATTLVHELGHLFGLDHDRDHQNLMCSCRVGPTQDFTRKQGVSIRQGAAQFIGRVRD